MRPLLLILAVVAVANACRFPSHLWCSSEEIALECKVYQQCKESDWAVAADAPPVALDLYFESLCPDCQEFITQQLYPTYNKVRDIFNVTLVPYGNARTCAIHSLNSDMTKVMPLINCIESSTEKPIEAAVQSCAEKHKVDFYPIITCYNSSLGNELEHQMAVKTDSLKPKHTYVPWVVLNGVHTPIMQREAEKDLLKLLCKTYTGPKPPACTQEEEQPKSVCFRDDLH